MKPSSHTTYPKRSGQIWLTDFSPLSSEPGAGGGGPGGLEPKQYCHEYYNQSDDYYTTNPLFPVKGHP